MSKRLERKKSQPLIFKIIVYVGKTPKVCRKPNAGPYIDVKRLSEFIVYTVVFCRTVVMPRHLLHNRAPRHMCVCVYLATAHSA